MTRHDPAATTAPTRPPLGVGLVGCGRIARAFHLPTLRSLPGARLVAVADPDPDARQAATAVAGPHVAAVAEVDALLARDDVDAVVVCAPTDRHEEVAVAAFEAGRHVYVEKPLAADAAAAARIDAAWRASGRIGVVGYNLRFHPLYVAARRELAEGHLGDLVAVRTLFASSPRRLPSWKQDRRTGGGALLDLATHHVDLVTHLLDTEVATVGAAGASVVSDLDTVHLQLTTTSGVTVSTVATLRAPQTDRVELLGDRASLDLDRMRRRRPRRSEVATPTSPAERLRAATDAALEGIRVGIDGIRPPAEPSFGRSLAAFVAAVRGGRFPAQVRDGQGILRDTIRPATIGDGLAVAQVTEAAHRALDGPAASTLPAASGATG
jgi:predicted dehydrogenase